jgi:hypothetical protein
MEIVTQFLNFNKMMGQGLVKIVYYLGLAGILLGVLFAMFTGISFMSYDGGTGFGMIVGAVIGGLLGMCFLRFTCELYVTLFRMGEDIHAMRGAGGTLPPKT